MDGRRDQGMRMARCRQRLGRLGAEQAVRLARHLDNDERRLVEQVYRHGQPVAGLAALAGVRPEVLRRRLTSIGKRMQGPDFQVVSECLELFPAKYQPVARLKYLQGYSLQRLARVTGLTLHQARQQLCAVEALISVARQLMAADAVAGLGRSWRQAHGDGGYALAIADNEPASMETEYAGA